MSRKRKRRVTCSVTGVCNGPPCPTCKKSMDTVVLKGGENQGQKGHYCFECTHGVRIISTPRVKK